MLLTTLKQAGTAFRLLLVMTVLTGVIYPLTVTLFAHFVFPWQANGSLISNNGQIMGSTLLGQAFTDPAYFWPRPSATAPFPNNALQSSGSNLGPSNPLYEQIVKNRIAQLTSTDPTNNLAIPVDLVTASGSGLDPDISPYAAFYQAHRIAVARGIPDDLIQQLIDSHVQPRDWFILGEPRINVLELNMALDKITGSTAHANTTPQS